MYMSYSNNPNLPLVRMEAIKLVRSGWSVRKVARHLGFTHSAIVKWMKRAPSDHRIRLLPTESPRPMSHPKAIGEKMESTIIKYRLERNQCAVVLHHRLLTDGYDVSLSSVKRVLQRNHMTRFSRWKKWHSYPPRPLPEGPGMLVEIDTIHDGPHTNRLYIYTLLDVCSRWAYALPSLRITTHRSLRFVDRAREVTPFIFRTLQSDYGSEFSKWFTKRIIERGMAHRHSRVRQPNDNAHLERFNRTIQDECISRLPKKIFVWKKEIPEYLDYYNTKRPHMGLDMKTPLDIVKTVPRY